jgi:hypothetical protein
MKIETYFTAPRKRDIDSLDKFFHIKTFVFLKGNYQILDVGWIEKSFVKDDFIKSMKKEWSFEIFEPIEVVAEFCNESEYKKYKIQNNLLF